MMVFADPFRMVVEPPVPIVPHVTVVIIAVVGAPLGIDRDPFRMMGIDPARMMFMPLGRFAPCMMVVPVTVTVVRMSNRRRSRKQRSQSRGRENSSKFHFGASWNVRGGNASRH